MTKPNKNNLSWTEETFVAVDLETTGPYPIKDEICEFAAIKWSQGKIVDEYQTLVRPSRRMSEEVIKIHGITNEMVESEPQLSEVISRIHSFIGDDCVIAHHAPFDLGFLTYSFENFDLPVSDSQALCSSLLSRKLIPESPNHKLQTLISFLSLSKGVAHRALDDTKACLDLALKCFERVNGKPSLSELFSLQEKNIYWPNFSIQSLKEQSSDYILLERAILKEEKLILKYSGGSKPGQEREILPLGVVRNPDKDYLVAIDVAKGKKKRYYLNSVLSLNS